MIYLIHPPFHNCVFDSALHMKYFLRCAMEDIHSCFSDEEGCISLLYSFKIGLSTVILAFDIFLRVHAQWFEGSQSFFSDEE
jgi:hypothetical protein